MATQDSRSLYERLGGIYSIATVVDDLIDRVMADPRLNANPLVDDAHHKVHVDDESIPTNLSDWDIFDPGSTAAHEFGHMIGKFDEYVDEEVPGREHVLTGTIMEDNSSNFTPRMFTRFARNILCFVTDETGTTIPKPY